MWITSLCLGIEGNNREYPSREYPTFRLGIRDLCIHDVGYSINGAFRTVTI